MPSPSAKRRVIGIIPARYESSRFPGKPLIEILGKPMFQHVYERASQCPLISEVALATDDQRIADAARDCGVPVVMTSPDHPSGTDRVFEAAKKLGTGEDDVVVNIQGDEPALNPEMLRELIAPFDDPTVQVATLARTISAREAQNSDVVKVVLAANGDALYFSRAPIPHDRDPKSRNKAQETSGLSSGFLGHVGLYGSTMGALTRFTSLPGRLEEREKLEQLRLLENGIPIRVSLTEHISHGVDRPEDIAIILALLTEKI